MSRQVKRDIPASVRARLQNFANSEMTLERLLVRYGVERLLVRLELSPYSTQFLLKGAQLFLVWTGRYYRTTRDIDFLGMGDPDPGRMKQIWKEICLVPCPEDGLQFDPDSVTAEEIREGDGYGGIRVTLLAYLSKARIHLQVDVGFGDTVTPRAEKLNFPALLDMNAPQPLSYPRETVVAEKCEAMVKLGLRNTRMKDFYDLHVLASAFSFDGPLLVKALTATFKRRKTALPDIVPDALTTAFYQDQSTLGQWRGFLRKGGFTEMEESLEAVCLAIERFVMPPMMAASSGQRFDTCWKPGGPWQ